LFSERACFEVFNQVAMNEIHDKGIGNVGMAAIPGRLK
jgi:hypothetical protein